MWVPRIADGEKMNSPEIVTSLTLTAAALAGLLILRLRGLESMKVNDRNNAGTIWDAIDNNAVPASHGLSDSLHFSGSDSVGKAGLFDSFSSGWSAETADRLDALDEFTICDEVQKDGKACLSRLPHAAKEYLLGRLTECETSSGVETLLGLCCDSNNVISGKARKLMARVAPQIRNTVVMNSAAAGRDSAERLAAMEVMSYVDDPEFIPVLASNIKEGGKIALAAASVLGRSENPGALAPLQEHLKQLDNELEAHFMHMIPSGRGNRKEFMPEMDEEMEAGSPEEILAEVISGTPGGTLGKAHLVPLIRALSDTSLPHQIRYHAAAALGRIGAPLANESLVRALEDSADTVRYGSIQALAELGNINAAPLIARKLRDANEFVRSAAAHALARLNARESFDDILRGMDDSSGSVRYSCLKAALELDAEASRTMVLKGLSDLDEQVRIVAVRAVSSLKDRSSVGHIINLLGQSDGELRIACAETLFELEDSRAIEPLIDMLKQIDSELIRMAGDMVRTELEEERRNISLEDAISRGDEQQIFISTMAAGKRKSNGGAVNELGDENSLWEALKSDSIFVIGSAMLTLAEHGEIKRFMAHLKSLGRHASIYVRETVGRALGVLAERQEFIAMGLDSQAMEILRSLARDREETVRFAAARSLGKFNVSVTEKILRKLARDRSAEVANAAKQALEPGNGTERDGRRFLLRGPRPELSM
ncbi:MAG: hypothetical protein CVV64_10970 [Candidatus Wallbacteria bacterium HGW-Wallbacteria-1]|jgi:HEAT repeat protein|uniref:HEAT repeat domain-containing protein n=1 Tax=Candidatus Wallbacteria bacterium HGW-Wallbacteria-1 TaxID=2013854 RepID=A0A2N1PPH7_9BACT|nr:MAG: hypothetical protein CVV64_10970 [Candidatus Wallbacteria bacterium HGW-Wallbacteria-1]